MVVADTPEEEEVVEEQREAVGRERSLEHTHYTPLGELLTSFLHLAAHICATEM